MRAAESTGLQILVQPPPKWFPRLSKRVEAMIDEETTGLLADDADWDADTWAMDPAGLERLTGTLEWLCGRLPGDFTFEAMWESPKGEADVSRQELLAIVRAGRIGNNIVYRVRARGA